MYNILLILLWHCQIKVYLHLHLRKSAKMIIMKRTDMITLKLNNQTVIIIVIIFLQYFFLLI